MKTRTLGSRCDRFALRNVCLNSLNNLNALDLDSPEAPEQSSKRDKGSTGSVDDHVSFPLVFEVACASNLDECEENPREEENEPVHEEEGHAALDSHALSSQLANVGLQIVCRQVLEFH